MTLRYILVQVWLVWTDKTNERQEKSIRQLAQEARQGNAHDENVLTYYRYGRASAEFGPVGRREAT